MKERLGQQHKGVLLPAGLILGFMGLTAVFGLPQKRLQSHLEHNRLLWQKYLPLLLARQSKAEKPLPWIERQDELGDFAYGLHRSLFSRLLLGGRVLLAKENACEVIAVYNALLALQREQVPDLPGLLSEFEKKGISFGGYFGTSFHAICRFFSLRGYEPQIYRGRKITPQILEKGEAEGVKACILMTENHAGHIKEMVHTICISREEDWQEGQRSQKWRAHNDYEGSRISPSLTEAVMGYHQAAGRPLGVILLF